jgi:two-component sensor histidine kinase
MFFDDQGRLIYANKYSRDLYHSFGFSEILGLSFEILNMTSIRYQDAFDKAKSEKLRTVGDAGANLTDELADAELLYFKEDSVAIDPRYFRIRFAILRDLESFLIMFVDDISEVKCLESGQRNFLITNHELQHRIKNNLMTVASLLRIQARQCDNEQAREIINVGVNRINSIATTFDLLSRGDKVAVAILDVFKNVRENHLELLTGTELDLEITVSGENYILDSERSSTLALAVNELVQNSIKHAFPNRKRGKIDILTASDDGTQIVQIKDDGIGFDSNIEKKGALGLTLIKGLIQTSMNGKVTIESGENGTTVSIVFKQYNE